MIFVVAFHLTTATWLAVDSVAVYRLTRLVTTDRVLEPVRKRIHDSLGMAAFDFITCPWCTSIWIAAIVVVLTYFVPEYWVYVAYLLACSAVAGYLMERA